MAREEYRSINKNYAELNLRIMQIVGFWNPYKQGVPFRLYKFYTITIFTIVIVVYTFLEILDAIAVKDDLQLLTQNVCITFTHITSIAKMANLLMRKEKIYTIIDILERALRQEDEGTIDKLQVNIIKRAIRQGDMVTIFFAVSILVTAVIGLTSPFWDQSYEQWDYPYRCYIPMSVKQSTPYWIPFTFIGVCAVWNSYIVLSHDTLVTVFMIYVVGHITILKSKIETVCNMYDFNNYTAKFEDEIRNRDLNNNETLSRSMIVALRQRAENKQITNLKSCIKYHQEIIRLVSELESMFSSVVLVQFATSLISIGLTGFQVTASESNGRLLSAIGFLCCVLLQLLLYCWYGNEMIVQSEGLGNSAYVCSWYQEEQKFCKILEIFMARTQKPLVLTAGNLCDLSLTTFSAILSNSYSYMAVLNQINE